MNIRTAAVAATALFIAAQAPAHAAAPAPFAARIDAAAKAVEPRLIAWRRDIHQNPELGNAETRTAALVAEHLRRLGMEVRTGVAGTGVVGVLKGGRPGPVVALRADMDALPVKEDVNVPFASKAKGTYQGNSVDVMHACGHDAHTAILMAAADVLAGMKADLAGSVVFIFQPAEEGPSDFEPDGTRFWGARQMITEGVLDNPKPEVIFGLHVQAETRAGDISWRPGPVMAASDRLNIRVQGRQTHGAIPWMGVDPIVVASQIVLGLQTIESRQVNVGLEPSVLTIGVIGGGLRYNIIPDAVTMDGTIRTYDRGMQRDIHMRTRRTAELIAQSGGATAEVKILENYGPTVNNPALTERMAPTLMRVAGDGRHFIAPKLTGSEDFSFFQEKIPGLFFFLGITPAAEVGKAPANHSPQFHIEEAALIQGVRAFANLAVDYMAQAAARTR